MGGADTTVNLMLDDFNLKEGIQRGGTLKTCGGKRTDFSDDGNI